MPPRSAEPNVRLRFQIRDMLAVVVGYGMAAVFFRAFWPANGLPPILGAPALGLYLWLGLALSGPIVLVRRGLRRTTPTPAGPAAESRTWAEWAWLFVGTYWVVLGLFAIPARLGAFRMGDALVFGLLPIVVATVLRLAETRTGPERSSTAWAHFAAVGLLATWPIAWLCLIVLGNRLH